MLQTEPSITVLAAGKINLFLDVLRRRPDGYHDIRSILLPVSLQDRLVLTNAPEGIETITDESHLPFPDGGGVGESDGNLTTRAARRLRDATGHSGGVRIHLEKHIPVGGGMGGGSADAAAVLVALNRLWGTGLAPADLMRIGAAVGSDVPALVHGGAVCMEGMGDCVRPIAGAQGTNLPEWWVVLANAGVSVSTRDIYERHSRVLTSESNAYKSIVLGLEERDLEVAARGLYNALERTVFAKYPLLEMMAQALRECGAAGARLSGSGGTVFALARGRAHAVQVETEFRRRFGAWAWSQVVLTLPDGVMVAHGPLEARV